MAGILVQTLDTNLWQVEKSLICSVLQAKKFYEYENKTRPVLELMGVRGFDPHIYI